MLHTCTHTSAPSNNPLILFIISQLFLVRAIHGRNHTQKHTPMCRAEIQYKYTHLYFLISSSIFTPFCRFSLRSVMHQLCSYTSQSHINAQPLRNSSVCFLRLRLKSFAKLCRAHSFTLFIGFYLHTHKTWDISLWDIANKSGPKLQLNFFPLKEKAHFLLYPSLKIGI